MNMNEDYRALIREVRDKKDIYVLVSANTRSGFEEAIEGREVVLRGFQAELRFRELYPDRSS